MKRDTMLAITSPLSILGLSFHITQDALLQKPGTWPAGPGNFVVIVALFVYLCGTLLLMGRRSGYIITLICALSAFGMPAIHLTGGRFNPARHSDAFFFMWILIALGVTGLFGLVLSIRGLWSIRRGE